MGALSDSARATYHASYRRDVVAQLPDTLREPAKFVQCDLQGQQFLESRSSIRMKNGPSEDTLAKHVRDLRRHEVRGYKVRRPQLLASPSAT